MLIKRSFLLGALAIPAATYGACGSPEPRTPLEVLQHSFERSKDIKNFRAHMDLGITTPDEQVRMAMETGRNGRVRTDLNIDIDIDGDKQTFQTIIAKPYVYVHVPDAGWDQMSLEAIAESTGQSLHTISDPMASYTNLFPAQEVPWELYVVESLGHEKVDGIQTEHLSIQFDFHEVWQHLDEDQKVQFIQASTAPKVAIEQLIEAVEVRGVEVWIDDQGYTRRTTMEIRFIGETLASLGGGEVSTKIDARIFDINKEITINLPEGYEDFEREEGPASKSGPMSAYEELLSLIPNTPETRSYLLINDYARIRELFRHPSPWARSR